ncbi:MAG: methyltransferase domain-containing protein [Gammaproteobacteria bacterium]|nr:methyltransferase domain-containing protein [Gammaproteobacteria bacterium]NND53761.1 methyltransferase domain-containing protein [Gammaproteobacteria bacterium]
MHEIDQQQLRRANDRIAAGFDAADFFCAEVRGRLLERLQLMTLEPGVILDLGAGTGAVTRELQRLYPDAACIALDWSPAMLREAPADTAHRICADGHHLPLADDSVDIVVSNMMLPGCNDPQRIFSEAQRVLRSPGLFLFNTLGPDTLRTLQRAWSKVDDAPHVHVFADMHNVGDALVQAGFREPVMDVEHVRINYRDLNRLFADLRAVGATNRLQNRRRGLTTPRLWQRMLAAADQLRNEDGKFPVLAELVTGQAWTGAPAAGVQMSDGEAHFPVSRLRGNRMGFD